MTSEKRIEPPGTGTAVLNLLAEEKSPYLLQHKENPVDWHPWGEEALKKAREENKPVFLSIGYATCHWCHVMAHESFENQAVANILNEHFISIKVDREERPDIDLVYMNACQAMTRGGGWPLSIFMTPQGKPFFAGTYFPREPRMGMPGFTNLLQRIASLWVEEQEKLIQMGEEVVGALEQMSSFGEENVLPGKDELEKAFQHLHETFDPVWGGFGAAPKFPMTHNLTFLLRWHHRTDDPKVLETIEKNLKAMRNGGIFDQIGFGFHRYSVDEKWLVPHFEKMLYDQAQLAIAYTEAYQATDQNRYATVVREIFTYVLRDMTSLEGGFYSAEDADTEGKEGLYYVWKPEEILDILGRDLGERFCRFYGIDSAGNFEDGLSIPHITTELAPFAESEGISQESLETGLQQAREKLLETRFKRIPPLKDDKILTAWNGLMIAALAMGSRALEEPSYAEAGGRAADFIMENLTRGKGRLLRSFRDTEAALPGYADDYAFFIWGLIELYETTFDVRYLEEALLLQESMVELFWDTSSGGFFFAGSENETLIVQSKDAYDQALPSHNSVATMNLLRLGRMTGNPEWDERAQQVLRTFSESVRRVPVAHTYLLAAVDFILGPSREIVIAGPSKDPCTEAMIQAVQRPFLPNTVLLLKDAGEQQERIQALAPFLDSMEQIEGKPAAYVCEQYSCKQPITNPDELRESLRKH